MNNRPVDARFWLKDGDAIAETIVSNARRIAAAQEDRRQDRLINASMYGDVQMIGFSPGSYSQPMMTRGEQLSLNVVKNMVGACKSRIAAKAKPKPSFVTIGGDWLLSRRAKKLEKAIDGTFYQTKFYGKALRVFVDGAVVGDGHIRWYPHVEAKQVVCERLLPGEWLIENAEGLYGDEAVRTGYLSRYYDKLVLCELHPDAEEEIMNAKPSEEDEPAYGYDPCSDQVLVREAIRLPSWKGAKDGMWARCIDGKLLGDPRPYKRDYFNVASWRWEDALAGFYGISLAHDLRGIQLSINDHLDEIDDLLHTIKGKWLVEEFSRVNTAKLNDEGDGILFYRGTAPIYISPQVIPPELYQHLWNLVQKAYEIAGISQLAASSQKPAGINSGAGLRAMRDQQSERFLDKFESWDEFILQNARLAHDALRDLAEATQEDIVISARRGHVIESIKFKENDFDEGTVYELQIVPTSFLPSTPAGKIAFAEDMARIGIADPEELLELISMPDTERFTKRRLATRNLVEDMIEGMLETDEFEPPEPFMFWPVALKVAVESYLEARGQKCPPAKLDLVARWIVLARMMMRKEQEEAAPPPPPPMPPGPPGPPMLGGEPPPRPLLPGPRMAA